MANNPTHDENPEPIDPEGHEDDALPGNRPAENALRATAESDLNKSWQGGEGAADFLGLDQEVGRPQEPDSYQLEEPELAETETVSVDFYAQQSTIPVEAPLHVIEQQPDPEPYYQYQPSELPVDPTQRGDQNFGEQAPTGDEASWLLQSRAQGADTTEDGDYLGATAEDLEVAEALDSSFSEDLSGRSPRKMLAIAAVVLIAAGGTWFFGLRTETVDPTQIASVTPPTTGGTTSQSTLPTPVTNGGTGTEVAQPVDPSATSTQGDEALLAELADLITAVDGNSGTTPAPAGPSPVEPGTELPAPINDPLATAPAPGTPEGDGQDPESGDRVERVVQIDPGDMILLPDYSSSLRLASDEEMGMLWSNTEIPFEKFKNPTRLLTPNVGRVRVVIAGDEIFEGSLYAVGEGHVWIDSKIGRIALNSATVHDIHHIGGTERTPELGGKGSEKLAGLPRVRVRGAGGNFYGKVVAREGDFVTLIPDSGGRIRLQSSEVEIVGNMRTSLVRADVE